MGGGSLGYKGHWELGGWQAKEWNSVRLATSSTDWSLEYLLGERLAQRPRKALIFSDM